MEERVRVQDRPVGRFHTVEQSVAANPLTFHAGERGFAIAVALPSTHTGWCTDSEGGAQPALFHEGRADTASAR